MQQSIEHIHVVGVTLGALAPALFSNYSKAPLNSLGPFFPITLDFSLGI